MRRWLGLALLAGACADFDHPSTVKDLRVLAVAAEPSEVILDPAAGTPIPPITFTALVVDPAGGGRPLAFTVRACANDPSAPSAPGSGSEASGNYPAGGARSTVGSARCPADGPASWTLPVAVAAGPDGPTFTVQLAAEQLKAAFEADVFPGLSGRPHGGFDLGLPITVELTVAAGAERVVALKRVLFWRERLGESQRPNHSPVIGEVRAYAERDPVTLLPTSPAEPLAPDAPRALFVDQRLWLEPAGAQAEPYLTTVIDRFTDETRPHQVAAETLRYQFFATAGKFEPWETTSELPFGATPAGRVPTEGQYQPPAADTLVAGPDGKRAREVTIWIVARDERGGASWTKRRLLISDR
jgi:hypothetical protein